MVKIRGVFTAIVTPFTEQDELNEESLRQLIRFQIAAGVNGIVALGTTGEAPTLTAEEKERVIRIAREETRHKVHLMVGTGSYSTANTIANSLQAKDLGADSVLVVAPYYNKPTQEGLYLHYKALSDAMDIPIMVYNHQGRTGQNLQTETLARIAQLPYICGVKEASGNLSQMVDVMETIGRKYSHFSVMSGDDGLTLPCMAMGGDGIISVVSNLTPIQICALAEAASSGDYAKAREIHYALMPWFRAAFLETNPIPIKAAMNFTGLNAGGCRLPLCGLTPENEKKLKQVLSSPNIAKLIHVNQALYRRDAQLALTCQNM